MQSTTSMLHVRMNREVKDRAMIALAATPFSLKAEYGAVTGRDPDDLTRQIVAMIRCLLFVEDAGGRA